MAFGTVSETFEYVLEEDRNQPEELQTIFHVRQRAKKQINKVAAEISGMQTSRTARVKKVSANDLERMDVLQWGQIVEKVNNYFIHVGAARKILEHFKLDGQPTTEIVIAGKTLQFHCVDEITDESGLQYVCDMLSSQDFAEIVEFSDSIGRMTEPEKKD